jgi:hypothetical protein
MKPAVALVVMLLSSAAHAATWEYVTEAENYIIGVAPSTIAPVKNYRKAWVLFNYRAPEKHQEYPSPEFRSIKQLSYFDCTAKQSTNVQTVYYDGEMGGGKSVKSYSWKFQTDNLEDIVPDSTGESILNYVCGQKLKK